MSWLEQQGASLNLVIQLFGRMHGSHTNARRSKWLISMQTSNEENIAVQDATQVVAKRKLVFSVRNSISCVFYYNDHFVIYLLIRWLKYMKFMYSSFQCSLLSLVSFLTLRRTRKFIQPPWYKGGVASYLDVSLSMKMCAQKKAGRRQRTRRCFACRLYPSHGPLRFITNRSQLPCEKRSA